MLEFKVNDFLSLRNDGYETDIYVKGKKFIQCKFLLINIPVNEITSLDNIKSIDEVADNLDQSLEGSNPQKYNVGRRTEFWAHCSNLQLWAEHGYDTKLLHRNLSFPLLKKLTEMGDKTAEKVFKEEVAKRMMEGSINVALYLLKERYLDFLTKEEKMVVFLSSNKKLKEQIFYILKREECVNIVKSVISNEMARLIEKVGGWKIGKNFREDIENKIEEDNIEEAISLIGNKYWEMYHEKEIEYSFYKKYEKTQESMGKLLSKDNVLRRNALLVLKELAELGDVVAKQKSIEVLEKELKKKKMSVSDFLLMEGIRQPFYITGYYHQTNLYYNYGKNLSKTAKNWGFISYQPS